MKKILFVLIITIALILGVSCDGSGPAAPASNNSSGNESAAKTVCYVYQHPVVELDTSFYANNHCAFIASNTLESNENAKYYLNFDGYKLDIIEKNISILTDSGVFYNTSASFHNVLETYTSADTPEVYYLTDTPSEAQKNLMWKYAGGPTEYEWGCLVKIAETDTKVYYAVCPLVLTFLTYNMSGSLTDFTSASELVSQKAALYYYCPSIEHITYKETVNGCEYYDLNLKENDIIRFSAFDNTFEYANPKTGNSFDYNDLIENSNTHFFTTTLTSTPSSTVLTSYDWIFQDAEKWVYTYSY